MLIGIMSLWGSAVFGGPRQDARQRVHTQTATDEKLSIKILQLDPLARSLGLSDIIYLDGIIDTAAANRFEHEVNTRNIESAIVHLNSPGGNLFEGMRLGRLIRKFGFSTYVGRWEGKALTKAAWMQHKNKVPGECYSACVFAFVGGYFRYLTDASTIGVHRFSKTTASSSDLALAQVISGQITSYLSEMGVDVALFELMSQVSSDGIRIISETAAKRYRVVNNGYQPSSWSIEVLKEGIYLRGVQTAWYGTGKANFICGSQGRIAFMPMYQAGDRAESISKAAVKHSFRVDEMFLPLETTEPPVLDLGKGYVGTIVGLPEEYISLLLKAKTVGYAVHPLNPGIFWGFTVDIDNAGEKINNFINNCKYK